MANFNVVYNTSFTTNNPNRGVMGNQVWQGEPYPVQSQQGLGATKSIAGFVYDHNGAGVVGATVILYRSDNNIPVAVTTSGMGGAYVFNRRGEDTTQYYAVGYSIAGGTTQIHGVSDRGLVPL